MTEPPKDGDERVRRQYEALPYPARDPADEAKRLVTGSPSHLLEIEHFVFAGRRAGALRALVAGGGTGDAAIMLAQQLADRGEGGEVVYLDISSASLAVAKARAEARGLANIAFHQGSLLELEEMGLGRFDYVDCCGVLHHLDDPAAGLDALVAGLAQDGGLGLMLYGALGRTGVYPLQRALRRLGREADTADQLGLARQLLDDLPESNWFRRNPFLGDYARGDDAGLFDLLLHGRDRAYTVDELVALADGAGLRITGFVPGLAYDPAVYLTDEGLKAKAAALPPLRAAALAEELAGSLKTHVFYCVLGGNGQGGLADARDFDSVPSLREHEAAALARSLAKSPRLKLDLDGVTARFQLPDGAAEMVRLTDGSRSLRDIFEALRARNPRLTEASFQALFEKTLAVLGPLNILLFGGPGAPAR
ncbi:MAG: class I SAM-dependent methyltransferase [Alphaproteobacteria bacterium]|nr:class I SAM-dependent methyltransferase [Alphaproteobacteria bacterium]